MTDLDWSEALREESERVEWKESGRQAEEILHLVLVENFR